MMIEKLLQESTGPGIPHTETSRLLWGQTGWDATGPGQALVPTNGLEAYRRIKSDLDKIKGVLDKREE